MERKIHYRLARQTRRSFTFSRARRQGPARLLTNGTPSGSPTGDRSMIQQVAVPRTAAPFLPATMNQPILGRFAPVGSNCFQCRAANRPTDPPEIVLLMDAQIPGARGRIELDLPQDFIGHPVADSREKLL